MVQQGSSRFIRCIAILIGMFIVTDHFGVSRVSPCRFSIHVQFENKGLLPVQLLTRHWVITNAQVRPASGLVASQ